eukprot:TRINITY_DN2883_c0_g1_i1.p1 TRINITY_DN2883_c0_g1~~TRINITY_DN2883_c0_g1_i1.p1  ORF type:complete len:657 (-),score=73.87 TRINITY_DN2883_c0_g1_i1:402-2372(-)
MENDFEFPYSPYQIQLDFMSNLYTVLKSQQVGIFESPTGTGKSLSLICGALKWLNDVRQDKPRVPQCTSWVGEKGKRKKQPRKKSICSDRFLINQTPLDQLAGLLGDSDDDESSEDEYVTPKILYASRTHTQLNQFIHELARTKYWQQPDFQVVQLAGRSTFCINEAVRKKAGGQLHRINEICSDLQIAKPSAQDKGCPYLLASAVKVLRDTLLANSHDIEDVVVIGRRLSACPYFASRAALRAAAVITLPYQALLSKTTRKALGINLSNCVVIIDEAHNLVDTINNLHSAELSYTVAEKGTLQLQQYFDRYNARLLAKNRAHVRQLHGLVQKFSEYLRNPSSQVPADTVSQQTIITTSQFLFQLGVDNINLFEIQQFIQESDIIRKLDNILENEQVVVHRKPKRQRCTAERLDPQFHKLHLYAIPRFLAALTNADQDGRVLVVNHKDYTKSCLKYILLNPSACFADVLDEARAVVLAGGTMHPIESLVEDLFPLSFNRERLHIFSCGHVVPKDNLLAVSLSSGPTGAGFDLTYTHRSPQAMQELGRLVANIVNVAPDGVVVFFPSYHFEDAVISEWSRSGILARIERKKAFFREPRTSDSVEAILQAYAAKIRGDIVKATSENLMNQTLGISSSRGAVLSCVVGGKMSEGGKFLR